MIYRTLEQPDPLDWFAARATGTCSYGFERNRGRLTHAVLGIPSGDCDMRPAACGYRPGRLSSGWGEALWRDMGSTDEPVKVTCPRCRARGFDAD